MKRTSGSISYESHDCTSPEPNIENINNFNICNQNVIQKTILHSNNNDWKEKKVENKKWLLHDFQGEKKMHKINKIA